MSAATNARSAASPEMRAGSSAPSRATGLPVASHSVGSAQRTSSRVWWSHTQRRFVASWCNGCSSAGRDGRTWNVRNASITGRCLHHVVVEGPRRTGRPPTGSGCDVATSQPSRRGRPAPLLHPHLSSTLRLERQPNDPAPETGPTIPVRRSRSTSRSWNQAPRSQSGEAGPPVVRGTRPHEEIRRRARVGCPPDRVTPLTGCCSLAAFVPGRTERGARHAMT